MEDKIKILEERVEVLEAALLRDPWRLLLDDVVSTYIREHYPYADGYDTDLYLRVLESMKEQIIALLMKGEH